MTYYIQRSLKMSQKQRNYKYATPMTVVMIVFMSLLVGLGNYKFGQHLQKRKQNKARQEQRGKDFANYIISDIRNSVKENVNDTNIVNAAKEYKQDSVAYKAHFAQLRQDSTKYADAIFRDAIIINGMDKLQKTSIPFEEALEYVNSQPAEYHVQKTKTYIHTEHDGFGGFNVWTEYVPTDEVIIEPNNSPARIIKINKRHLTRISLELATMRMGMQR